MTESPQPVPECDDGALHSQVARFIDAIFEPTDLVEVRAIPPSESIRSKDQKPRSKWVPACELAEPTALKWMTGLNDEGWGIYIGANPRSRKGKSAKDVLLARCLFVDFDDCGVDEARRWIRDANLPIPTVVVDSGHGVHCWWRLEEEIADLDEWTRRQKAIIKLLESDRVVHDPPRVMRMPGFRNTKPPPRDAKLVEFDARRKYPLDEFPPAIESEPGGHFYQYSHTSHESSGRSDSPVPTGNTGRNDLEIERILSRTICTDFDQRRRRVFLLAKKLRGLDRYKDAEASEALDEFNEWHRRSARFMNHPQYDVSLTDFLSAWEGVKYPGVSGPLADAYAEAISRPLPDSASRYPSICARNLIALCCRLQEIAGDQSFFLVQTAAAELLDVKQENVSYWLKRFCSDDPLVLKKTFSGHTGKASEYRYFGVGGSTPDQPENPNGTQVG